MIALKGLSRFPVYLNHRTDEIFGLHQIGTEHPFKKYITSLKTGKNISIAIYQQNFRDLKRRMVIGGRVYHPEMERLEFLPRRIYVYPDTRYDKPFNDCMALGIVIKAKKSIFYPVVLLHSLSEDELKVMNKIIEINTLTLDTMLTFLSELGIHEESRNQLRNQTFSIKIRDDVLGESYYVNLDAQGRVLATNVCLTTPETIYFTEMVMLTRSNRSIYVYNRSGYDWAI